MFEAILQAFDLLELNSKLGAVATAQFDLMRVRNERAKFLELLISAASARAGRRAKKVSPGALASLDRHERRAASRRQKGLGNLS
jgi:hypothetical protein